MIEIEENGQCKFLKDRTGYASVFILRKGGSKDKTEICLALLTNLSASPPNSPHPVNVHFLEAKTGVG